jgi:putative flippase GtrA
MALIPFSISRSYLTSFVKFLIVGSLGFAINGSLLVLLQGQGLPFYAAQIMGAETALLSNFFFHDRWTFKFPDEVKHSKKQRLLLYHLSSLLGAAVNSAITILVHNIWGVPSLLALAFGSATALFVNYSFSAFVTWKKLNQS